MTIACLLFSMLLQVGPQPRVVLRSPLESRAREFVANFNSRKFDMVSKDFNETMRAAVTPAVLADLKQQSDSNLGRFQSIILVRQRREGGFRVVEIVCRYEKSLASFRVAFDSEDRIGALYLDPIAAEPVEPVLEAAARDWLRNVNAGDFEAATRHFEKNLQMQLSPSKLEKLQVQIKNSYGKFRSIKEVHQMTEEPFRTIDLIAAYERASVLIHVAFNSSDRITGIRLEPVQPEPPPAPHQ
ncbi:MAG: DUF3887 domain-containing protein [Acidobacteriota bacterium]|nr:DUF3887 domain-containing protein [Acidobacteriota bacterium]